MRAQGLLSRPRTYLLPLVGALAAAIIAALAGIQAAQSPRLLLIELILVLFIVMAISAIPSLIHLKQTLSSGEWWTPLLMLLFLSSLVLRIRSTTTISSNPLDIEALYRVALVGLVGLVLITFMITRQIDLWKAMTSGIMLLLFLFLLANMASVFWSVNPLWTLYRSIEFAIDGALIAAIVSRIKSLPELSKVFNWTWLLNGALLFTVILGVIAAPSRALPPLGGAIGFGIQGVVPVVSRNGVGHISAILILVAVSRLVMDRPGKQGYLLLLAGTLPLQLLAQTRSTLIPVFLAIPIILLGGRRFVLLGISLIGLVAFLVLEGIPLVFLEYLDRGVQTDLTTLTGRTNWWAYGLDMFRHRPLTGYGGYVAGRFIVGENFSENLSSLHNTYLEVLIGTSLWGLVPLVLLVLGVWIILVREFFIQMRANRGASLEWALAVEAVAIMILVTFRSFLSSSTMVWHPSFEFLILVAYAEVLRSQRKTVRRHWTRPVGDENPTLIGTTPNESPAHP